MAKVKDINLSFPPSDSPDVVGYKLYYTISPEVVTYDSPSVDLSSTDVNLSQVPGFINVDGIYNIGISAVDDVGNESDMSLLDSVPLDLVAPNPPGAISVA